MDDSLAGDFVALWQSELTAMAADREIRESWAAMIALWASAASAALQSRPRYQHDPQGGSAGTAQPPGAAPFGAAFEPGVAQIKQLNQRVAELEQRLAEFLAQRDRAIPG